MPTTRLQSAKTSTTPGLAATGKRSAPGIGRKRKGTISEAATKTRTTKRGKKEGVSEHVNGGKEKEDESERLGKGTRDDQEDQDEGKAKKGEAEAETEGLEEQGDETEEPPTKKRRGRTGPRRKETEVVYKEGVIERGHIYFFYRPKVMREEAESLDDVRNLHMLLVPRPPEWIESTDSSGSKLEEKKEEVEPEMNILRPGADVVPFPEPKGTKKHYRIITIGKKHMPTLELMAQTPGRRRRPVFWGTVTAVGDDLEELERGMGPKTYETKTRGTRYEAAVRLAARGVYAIVNRERPRVPSERETHFVYLISHPAPEEFGDVQHSLGILDAAAFVLQVKNPLAPPATPQQRTSKHAEYPEYLMRAVFGAGTGGKGRNDYGLRFAPVETPELLDYKGAEILFIAAREGQKGVEESIGEERGQAIKAADEREEQESIDEVYRELGLGMKKFPADPLHGKWI